MTRPSRGRTYLDFLVTRSEIREISEISEISQIREIREIREISERREISEIREISEMTRGRHEAVTRPSRGGVAAAPCGVEMTKALWLQRRAVWR